MTSKYREKWLESRCLHMLSNHSCGTFMSYTNWSAHWRFQVKHTVIHFIGSYSASAQPKCMWFEILLLLPEPKCHVTNFCHKNAIIQTLLWRERKNNGEKPSSSGGNSPGGNLIYNRNMATAEWSIQENAEVEKGRHREGGWFES